MTLLVALAAAVAPTGCAPRIAGSPAHRPYAQVPIGDPDEDEGGLGDDDEDDEDEEEDEDEEPWQVRRFRGDATGSCGVQASLPDDPVCAGGRAGGPCWRLR